MSTDKEHNDVPVDRVINEPLYRMEIVVYKHGGVKVNDFPTSLPRAIMDMDKAKFAIIDMFVRAAAEGRLHMDTLTLRDSGEPLRERPVPQGGSRIIVPQLRVGDVRPN